MSRHHLSGDGAIGWKTLRHMYRALRYRAICRVWSRWCLTRWPVIRARRGLASRRRTTSEGWRTRLSRVVARSSRSIWLRHVAVEGPVKEKEIVQMQSADNDNNNNTSRERRGGLK